MSAANVSNIPNSVQPRRMIAAPGVPFDQIAATLESLGWVRTEGGSGAPPLVPGEPESAQWTRTDGEATLHYTYQPVVGMRSLEFRGQLTGTRLAEAEVAIPNVALAELVALMRSENARTKMLGVLAAAELEAVPLYDEVRKLAGDADERVSRAAGVALRRLMETALQDAAVATAKAFPGDLCTRRQAVRRLGRMRESAGTAESAQALEAALADPDWEVRASAMLVAGRLGLRSLALQIRRLELPSSPSQGVHSDDGRILASARRAVLDLLNPRLRREDLFNDGKGAHLYRCVAGVEDAKPSFPDRVFLLIHALTATVEMPQSAPQAPECDVPFVWIPPVRHWIGAVDDLLEKSPLRPAESPGFFIAARPLPGGDGSPALLSEEQLESRLERLKSETGLALSLPSRDLLEMARRGSDGRLFPWGNGAESVDWPLRSAWGLDLWPEPEWTASRTPDGKRSHTSGPRDLRCAAFTTCAPLASARVMLIP